MRIILVALIFCIGIVIAYFMTKPAAEQPIKIYNPVDLQPEMVENDLIRKGFGHTIGAFSFLDQTGKPFGSAQLKGKVYVAEYFFSTCGTICPRMNAQMQRVQQAYHGNLKFQIVSLTVDPETDSVAQLAHYAKAHEANPKQWHFLTGKKEDLYRLARRNFFLLKPAEVKNQGDVGSDFIHTNNFVLIDQQQQIRGYFDGTNPKDVDRLILHIGRLLAE